MRRPSETKGRAVNPYAGTLAYRLTRVELARNLGDIHYVRGTARPQGQAAYFNRQIFERCVSVTCTAPRCDVLTVVTPVCVTCLRYHALIGLLTSSFLFVTLIPACAFPFPYGSPPGPPHSTHRRPVTAPRPTPAPCAACARHTPRLKVSPFLASKISLAHIHHSDVTGTTISHKLSIQESRG